MATLAHQHMGGKSTPSAREGEPKSAGEIENEAWFGEQSMATKRMIQAPETLAHLQGQVRERILSLIAEFGGESCLIAGAIIGMTHFDELSANFLEINWGLQLVLMAMIAAGLAGYGHELLRVLADLKTERHGDEEPLRMLMNRLAQFKN